ncbi:MAG TPA: molecular chaperone DnaJ, partial [Afipia sp.]|nr:molecular chaperone DnaJ [Afipia sp.]
MPTLIAGIVAVALLYVALNIIKGADPKWLAKIIRGGGGVVTLAAALF